MAVHPAVAAIFLFPHGFANKDNHPGGQLGGPARVVVLVLVLWLS